MTATMKGFSTGEAVKYLDPKTVGFDDPCGMDIDKWQPGDRLQILAFCRVEGDMYPVCWNLDKQTASSVVWDLIDHEGGTH